MVDKTFVCDFRYSDLGMIRGLLCKAEAGRSDHKLHADLVYSPSLVYNAFSLNPKTVDVYTLFCCFE